MPVETEHSPSYPIQVTVIIVNWNGKDLLPDCLDSIQQQDVSSEIIVVDNGSIDGSVDVLTARPDVRLICNSSNRGFAAGNNQGIDEACGRWIFLLNNDARLAPGALSALLTAVEGKDAIGSASPKILRADGRTIDSTGIVLQRRTLCPKDRGEEEDDDGQWDLDESRSIFGPSGAAALYRKEALENVRMSGGEILDEDFFAYYEDVDLAWRLQLAGWESIYVPDARVFHDRKGPAKKPGPLRRRAYVNRLWCFYKNEIALLQPKWIAFALLWEMVRFVKLVIRAPKMVACIGMLGKEWRKMHGKRTEIQKKRRRSSAEMDQYK